MGLPEEENNENGVHDLEFCLNWDKASGSGSPINLKPGKEK